MVGSDENVSRTTRKSESILARKWEQGYKHLCESKKEREKKV